MRVLTIASVTALCLSLAAIPPAQAKDHGRWYYRPLNGTTSAGYTFTLTRDDDTGHFEQRVSINWQGQPTDTPLVPAPYDKRVGYPGHGPTAMVSLDAYSYWVHPNLGECTFESVETRTQGRGMAHLEVQFPQNRQSDKAKLPRGRKLASFWFKDVIVYVTIATQIPTTTTSSFDEMTADGGCVRKTKVRQKGEEFKPTVSTGQEINAEFQGKRSSNSRTVMLNTDMADFGGNFSEPNLVVTGGGSITLSRNPRLRW